jgi:hypothetical protein
MRARIRLSVATVRLVALLVGGALSWAAPAGAQCPALPGGYVCSGGSAVTTSCPAAGGAAVDCIVSGVDRPAGIFDPTTGTFSGPWSGGGDPRTPGLHQGNPVVLSGRITYRNVCVLCGGQIAVKGYDWYNNTCTTKQSCGNLELVAQHIYVDNLANATNSLVSSITASGMGYRGKLCDNGPGPTTVAGGRGGCALWDSGGGGGHFGGGGRGTHDNNGTCTWNDPGMFEEDCVGSVNAGNNACVSYSDCRNCNGAPSVAGITFRHSIYAPEFGAAGGDKGCRDADGFIPYPGSGNRSGPGWGTGGVYGMAGWGGGRIVLVGKAAGGTGTVQIDGQVLAEGTGGCGTGNDSSGGGGGGAVLVVGDNVTTGAAALVSVAGGQGGDTQGLNGTTARRLDCPPIPSSGTQSGGAQQGGTCDDCGGGGGGGIISVLSGSVANLQQTGQFRIGGAKGGVCPICTGEAGGGAGELQLEGAYVGEICDGFDNDFDGVVDNGLPTVCGAGIPWICVGGVPQNCPPTGLCPGPVTDTRARFAVIVDTSGSMLMDLSGKYTFGDGSAGHLGNDMSSPADGLANDSRLFKAKYALTNVIAAYPEIDFALARYHQDEATNQSCQLAHWFECQGLCCSYDNPVGNTVPAANPACSLQTSGSGTMTAVNMHSAGDECINYSGSCGAPRRGADFVTGFGKDIDQYLMWIDSGESNFIATTTQGDYCFNGGILGDCEFRATGPTPLAGSLYAAYDFLSPIKTCDGAALGGCRKYAVILLTDGAESCALDAAGQIDTLAPVNAATALAGAGIKTYVIGFSVNGTELTQLNAIAAAGGTVSAFPAANESDIANTMAGIVADAVIYEKCNGIDDDCDGLTDEDFPLKGQPCDDGKLGICLGRGHYVCSADQLGVVCQITTPGQPPSPTEICCNGLDDNCDGRVDEGCLCGVEVCNGLDDNSNGQTDEHTCGNWTTCPMPGEMVDCGLDRGECVPGRTKCESARLVCDYTNPGQHFPLAETCDCKDNDCNGITDDGVFRACYSGAAGCALVAGSYVCQGICRAGTQACATVPGPGCVPNTWSPTCVGERLPDAVEVCNNLDDNCDGQIDENLVRTFYTGPLATRGVGVCHEGTEKCTAGVWGTLAGQDQVLPSPELCDGLDNDCNGLTDDNLTRPCYTGPVGTEGVGACRAGVQTCAAGNWGACVGEVLPSTEVCDGIDNDCDGSVDESLTRNFYTGPSGTQGVGLCHGGVETCQAGSWNVTTPQVIPAVETCDGFDNDCDGQTDENLTRTYYSGPGATRNVGACRDGIETCQGGGWVVTTPQVTPASEVCNGIDDNCNGTVDENLSRSYYTGPSGTAGVGLCHNGTEVCVSGIWSRNPATPGVVVEVRPAPEICDGSDNDCDGQTDEDLTRTYYSGPGGTRNVGECRDGVETCVGGNWTITTPQVLPAAGEACNGLDDNCNGQIDEGLTRSYYNGPSGTVGVGICAAGVETCVVGNWTVTTPAVVPRPEDCNGLDDDCDGTADDGLQGVPCYPTGTPGCNATLGVCVGTCALGTRSCGGGTWGNCLGAVTPVAEVCDGLDNDCDGQVDEDLVRDYYTGPGATEGVGLCHKGEETCHLGTWDVTTAQVVPVPEVCDLQDNDCNGQVDDGLDAVPCYTGPYGCNLQTGLCIGACTFGTKACVAGEFGACTGQIVPTAEVCNGLDDDCDGQIDEDLARDYYTGTAGTEGVGPCHHGVETCSDGQWLVTTPQVVPAPEQCNAIDDDCNGTTDDGLIDNRCYDGGAECNVLTASCIGQCRVGLRACESGSWSATCVGQQQPVAETCNCLDDDCDGQVDNPPPGQQLPGVGLDCTTPGGCNGTTICDPVRCAVVCKPTGGGLTEMCNGVDDDCDGQVDEPPGTGEPPLCDAAGKCAGPTTTCLPPFPQQGWDYVCAAGHNACIDGSIQCVGFVLPQPEICDGIDNDCDGVTDNGDLCDPGSVCYSGECVQPCKNDEFPCPSGRTCMAGPDLGARQPCGSPGVDECYCVPSICVGVECETGSLCREHDGACHSLCENVTCGANQECRFGQCVDCSVIGCPSGQLCAGGVCVDDPCAGKECPAGQNCVAGECVGSCENGCGAGHICRDGQCVEDPCASVVCSGVQVCSPETGECVANPCTGVSCAPGSVCSTKTGQCGTDPCLTTSCSDCQSCVADLYNMSASCEWNDVCTSTKLASVGGCAVAAAGSATPAWPALLLFGAVVLLGLRRRRPGSPRGAGLGRVALLALLALGVGACQLRWYELDQRDGGVWTHDGATDGGDIQQHDTGPKPDSTIDGTEPCIPIAEACNGRDDDCNGITDDVDPSLLQNDPNNCGVCGRSCDLPHTVGTCEAGACVFSCFPGWVDTNGDLGQGLGGSNGCECFQTNGGVEVCDGVDNDCDGVIDNVPPNGKLCDSTDLTKCADDPCFPVYGCPGGNCKGECQAGILACQSGTMVCDGMVGPSAEVCDGKDNDCNGATDDGVASVQPCYAAATGCDLASGTCTGTCKLGSQTCLGGSGWSACQGAVVPQPETCNGLDDDCDGEIDNPPAGQDLPGVNDVCYPAQGCEGGVCKGQCHAGAQQCVVGRLTCVGAQGPTPEVCDGLDNDCSGVADDGLPAKPCYTKGTGCDVQAGTCHGICKLGRISCLGAGGWSQCQGDVGPQTEVCNGIDDNCDGNVDEGTLPEVGDHCYTFGSGCNVAAGTCTGACELGHKSCQGGAVVCVGPKGPAPEVCDGIDNDCNGLTDDGLPPRACYTLGAGCDTGTGICLGICKMGRQACNGTPQWGACENQVGPSAEVCNGIDDNCDGQIDNPPVGQQFLPGEDANCYPAQGCEGGVCKGTCQAGKTRCIGGQLVCVGAVGPTAEVCDGLDNNCDGQTDEGLVPRLCYPTGQPGCDVGTGTCVGPCRFGRSTCTGVGGWSACTGAILPSAEVCDGLDNDCDGLTDNPPSGQQLPGVGADCFPAQGCNSSTGVCLGECKKGAQQCLSGSLTCVGAVGPSPEVCDGKDNDCNGTTDDGLLPRACYPSGTPGCNLGSGTCLGACKLGTSTCQGAGGWAACQGAIVPQSETCNGLDDDCNGTTDDGTLPGVGTACYTKGNGCTFSGGSWHCTGTCATGAQTCASGTLVCTGDVGPAPEVCDGLDNDCNGQTDEGLAPRPCYPTGTPGCNVGTSTCVGLCRLGTSTCSGAGGWAACAGAVTPVAEQCDGLDNDCNGQTDEGTMPGVGDTCYGAASGCSLAGGIWTCVGECRTGAKQCVTGNLTCLGYQGPVAEGCDNKDNDCNGVTDNGFNLQTDLYNCGSCGHDCTTLQQSTNAWPYCQAGACQRTCKADYWDNDGNYGNGCEYHCVNTGAEVCDGIDNDCNGLTDDSPVSPGNFCRQLGACAGSSPSCGTYSPAAPPESGDDLNQLAGWSLVGATDVNTDDGILFVTLADVGGTRTVSLYRDPALTELVARGSRAGDGLVTLAEQGSSGLSGQVTVTFAANDNTITIGVPIKAWICNYNPVTVDVVGLNAIAPQESKCDGLDNNCDGSTDERFFVDHIKGSACQQDGVFGECRGHGLWGCNGAGDAAVCDLTCGPPTCKLETAPSAETCDDKDNDCDGVVDNGIIDPAVHVTAGGLNFYVFTYEASRPGATASSAGSADHRACSQAGVLPWTFVSYADAADACAASGARLCTGAEWGAACGGSPVAAYPYRAAYQALTCNGEDYDGVPGGSDDDVLIPTGQAATCATPAPAIYDMSGNAKEWTSQYTGTTPAPDNTPIVVVRGGAYDTPAIGLRCDFTLSRAAVDVLLPSVGFRCCSPCAPSQFLCPNATVCTVPANCGGGTFCDTATNFAGVRHCARCVDALNDEANCGGCGVTCTVSQTCVNGVCR